jgi:hypothetical protein
MYCPPVRDRFETDIPSPAHSHSLASLQRQMDSKEISNCERVHVFYPMWKVGLKDKYTHKCIHGHIYIYRKRKGENMFVIVRLSERTRGKWERKRE